MRWSQVLIRFDASARGNVGEFSVVQRHPQQNAEVQFVGCLNQEHEARQHFSGHVKGFLSKCYEQKSAPVKGLKALIVKLGEENVEVQTLGCAVSIEAFDVACTSLQDRKASVKGWQRDNYVEKHTEAFGLLIHAAELQRK
eukprot:6104485-Amphidinium_carterae.1